MVFDADGNLAFKIKNLGNEYRGGLKVRYTITRYGNSTELIKKGEFWKDIDCQANEVQQVPLTEWGGFTFSNKGWDSGSPSQGIPSRFIPEHSRPFSVQVIITLDNDVNTNNNWVQKKMCMIQEADIGTDGLIQLTFNPKMRIYISQGTSNEIHEEQIKWLSAEKFEVNLAIFLWNYGCVAKTFDCWLYVDDQPGQLIGSAFNLEPGFRVEWKQAVTIRVQKRCGDHRLVFIADPKEKGHEPYPELLSEQLFEGGRSRPRDD